MHAIEPPSPDCRSKLAARIAAAALVTAAVAVVLVATVFAVRQRHAHAAAEVELHEHIAFERSNRRVDLFASH